MGPPGATSSLLDGMDCVEVVIRSCLITRALFVSKEGLKWALHTDVKVQV